MVVEKGRFEAVAVARLSELRWLVVDLFAVEEPSCMPFVMIVVAVAVEIVVVVVVLEVAGEMYRWLMIEPSVVALLSAMVELPNVEDRASFKRIFIS